MNLNMQAQPRYGHDVSPSAPSPDPIPLSELPPPSESNTSSPYLNLRLLIGRTPVIRKGATLIICPPNVLSTWAREIQRYLNPPPIIIVAHGSPFTAKEREGKYKGCYHYKGRLPWRQCPSRATLLGLWSEEAVDRWEAAGGVPICSLLSYREDDGKKFALPWQHRYWIITGPESLHKNIVTVDPSTGITNKCNSRTEENVSLGRMKLNREQITAPISFVT
ncbi:hypothetical protein LTR85_006524 [Meristemomyces frigidus]|nr:hypothetical protein LTR85_006524 [Meristemomyces frigidus]